MRNPAPYYQPRYQHPGEHFITHLKYTSDIFYLSLADDDMKFLVWKRGARIFVRDAQYQSQCEIALELVKNAKNVPKWLTKNVSLNPVSFVVLLNSCYRPSSFIPQHTDRETPAYRVLAMPRSQLNPSDWTDDDSAFLKAMLPWLIHMCYLLNTPRKIGTTSHAGSRSLIDSLINRTMTYMKDDFNYE